MTKNEIEKTIKSFDKKVDDISSQVAFDIVDRTLGQSYCSRCCRESCEFCNLHEAMLHIKEELHAN